jgi:hypothetical protein
VSRAGVAGAASLFVGGAIAIALLVGAFLPGDVHAVGWDAPGYVVQVRAARDGVVDLPASRPGVGVVGAVLDGIGAIPADLAPALLSLVAAVLLGLAAAVALARACPVAPWAVGAAVVLVATWGGTTRIASGYLANLLALTLFAGGVALALRPTVSWVAVAVAFAASLLAHPGLAPAWAAILLAWALVEGVARRDREPERAVRTIVAFLAAAVAVIAVVAWGLGLSLDDLEDLGIARERFDERAAEIVDWVQPGLVAAMAVVGIAVAALVRPEPRSRAAVRLGTAWLVVCAAGLPLLALVPAVPGHRLVLLAVPVPLLGAWAIVGGAGWAADRLGRAASIAAAAAAVTVTVALIALVPFDGRVGRSTPSIGRAPPAIAGYLAAADVHVPVVLVMDPPDRLGLLAWKARLNAVRALAPDDLLLRIVAYVGDERTLAAGRPTGGDDLTEAVSDRTWPSVREVLEEPHVVLIVRPWARDETWMRVEERAVDDDVAVVLGPRPSGAVAPVAVPSSPPLAAVARIAGAIAILAVLGLGWAQVLVAGDAVEVLGLAPIAGLTIVVLGGIGVALLGADPGGPAGLVAVGVTSLAGFIASWARDRADR